MEKRSRRHSLAMYNCIVGTGSTKGIQTLPILRVERAWVAICHLANRLLPQLQSIFPAYRKALQEQSYHYQQP